MSPSIIQIVADGNPGGGTSIVLDLCTQLQNGNWQVTLVTERDSYAQATAGQRGIRTIGLEFFRSRFDFQLAARLSDVLSGEQPDIVHAHGSRAATPACVAKRRGLPAPLLYTVHGYHFRLRPFPLRSMLRMAEKQIARTVDEVVFVSKADEAIARDNGIAPRHSTVVYNGVSCPPPEAITPGWQAHDLVFAGRMHRQKNPVFAIEVIKALEARGRRLLMVGGGDLEAATRDHARKLGVEHLVTFTGALPRPQVLAALRSARIFLFPSLWEGLPVGPMEAGALGLPTVGANIPGVREVVQSGATGCLIDDFAPLHYADAIERLLNNPSEYDAMSAAARRRITDTFAESRMVDQYRDIYTRLIRSPVPAAA